MNITKVINKLQNLGYRFNIENNKINYHLVSDIKPDPNTIKSLFQILKDNKDSAIAEIALNRFLEQERLKNKYDPRPDLEEDSIYWQKVLKAAEKEDRLLYGNLHGLRCIGCRLEVQENSLKLTPGAAIDDYYKNNEEWIRDRKEFLIPYAAEIKDIFSKVI